MTDGLAGVAWRPPVLRGSRVLLRGYELEDAPAIFDYSSDPETTRYVFWPRHSSLQGAHRFLNAVVAANYASEQLGYAICLADRPEQAIGGCGALPSSSGHNAMELGYVLNREHWGRGLVPEACQLLLAHAFASTDVVRVAAPILAENARSRRVADKLGMQLDGVLRSLWLLRGRRWDVAIHSILRDEWASRRAR